MPSKPVVQVAYKFSLSEFSHIEEVNSQNWMDGTILLLLHQARKMVAKEVVVSGYQIVGPDFD